MKEGIDMPIGNINNNVRKRTYSAVSRIVRASAQNSQRRTGALRRMGVYDEGARRRREDAQTAQGMVAVALATNPINQRMQNAQQEEPKRMSEHEVRNILEQISAGHYTAKNFNTSGLSDKLCAALDKNQPDNIRQEALTTLGRIYFRQPQDFNQSKFHNILANILDGTAFVGDGTQHENVRIEALKTLGCIYEYSGDEFNDSGLRDKLGAALDSQSENVRIKALKTLGMIYKCRLQEFNKSCFSKKLVAALDYSQFDNVRQEALTTLGSIYCGYPQEFNKSCFSKKLVAALDSQSDNVRQEALKTLGSISGREQANEILYIYQD